MAFMKIQITKKDIIVLLTGKNIIIHLHLANWEKIKMICENCGCHVKWEKIPSYEIELCRTCFKKPIRELIK